jgi:P-type Ca2+ transporter type 2C
MHRPPRDPGIPITNRSAVVMWLVYAAVLFVGAMAPLVAGPDEPSLEHASVSMTMTFVVMGLGTVFNALVNRRDPTSGLDAPLVKALLIGAVPVFMVFLATELPGLQHALDTTSLTGTQWLVCAGLAALLPLTVEVGKVIRRHRAPAVPAVSPAEAVVAPERARHGAA